MRSVLIVDDNQQLRAMIRLQFESSDWEVHEAPDAWCANEMVATATQPFTAILVDVHMPGPSGIDLMKIMRRADVNKDSVIACITGNASNEEESVLLGLKPDLIYRKPFNPEDLLDEIMRLVSCEK